MTVPNIDTFEHDVADEIKKKEASLTDIASASGDVGNAPETKKGGSILFSVLLGILFLVLIGAGGGYYYLFILNKPATTPPALTQQEEAGTTAKLEDISPTLAGAIGSSVESIGTSEYGFTIRLKDYTPVFAYMLRNENAYADEIAAAVGSPRDMSTTTLPFAFKDVTMSNQNMRVGTSASSTVIYAFVSNSYLVISSSTGGILSLRGAIIR